MHEKNPYDVYLPEISGSQAYAYGYAYKDYKNGADSFTHRYSYASPMNYPNLPFLPAQNN